MSDLRRVGSSDDDDVERRRQEPPPLSEYLPDDPLDAVSHHRVTDPRADRDAQSRDRTVSSRLHDDEARRVMTPPVTLERQELPPPPHPGGLGIPSGAGHGSALSSPGLLRRNGDGQALAPLGSAPLDHLATRRGRHAGAKPVRALTPSIARLIRPFHRETHPKTTLPGESQFPGGRGTPSSVSGASPSSRATRSRSGLDLGRADRDAPGVSRARVSASGTPGPPPPATGPFPRREPRTSGR